VAKRQQLTEKRTGRRVMLDVIFIAATALFFTVGIFYVRGCERLK
jgi:hypothetical protein